MTRPQRLGFLATALAVAATRFVALSRAAWDWDEVLFCLALGEYDMSEHQPHPPGFPLYIVLGRIARLVAGSDFHALQAVNVVAAMLVFPAMFALARALRFDFAASFSAALVLAFLPNVWFYGGTAFSDVPALVLFLAAAAAYLREPATPRSHALGSLFLGAALLIRPHNLLAVLYPWASATWRLFRERRIAAIVLSCALVVAIVAVGYGAAALASGVEAFVGTLRFHQDFVARADTMANPLRPSLPTILRMQLDPYDAGKVSILLNALALVGIAFGQRRRVVEILLMIAPYFVFMTFALSWLGFSRLSLSYMPGVVLLATEGIGSIAAWTRRFAPAVRVAFVAAIVARFVWWTLPAFEEPRKTIPPPTAAAQWVARNTDPATTTLYVHGTMWPWARYYAPQHRQVRVDDRVTAQQLRDAADGWLVTAGRAQSPRAVAFRRPHNRTWSVVAQRYFEAYVQPASDIASFGVGWHAMEHDEASQFWRWAQRRSVTYLPPMRGRAELELHFAVPVDMLAPPVRVTFTMNDQRLGDMVCTRYFNEARFVVDARRDGANVLRIDVDKWVVPGSGDSRELALKLYQWTWRAAPAAAQKKAA